MLTAIIVLSVFSGASLIVHLVQWAKLNKRKQRLASRDIELHRYRTDKDDPDAGYFVKPVEDGKYAVVRRTFPDYKSVETLIKVFDTEDAEYNVNGAVELMNNLNEKLCYN